MKLSNLIKMAAVAAALTLGGSPLAGSESRSDWKAHWITPSLSQSATNTWISYRKEFKVSECPDRLVARISADSKYWMWINGELAVFEGGLKRGPFPNGTYYDKVDIAPFLKEGDNTIAILLWHFGKQGFTSTQQTLDAEDRAFVLKIQDTVRAAVDEARFSTVLERMRESKQAQLNTQDLPGLVKLAGSSFGILEEEGKGVLQHLIEDGDFTLYGLANAVTRFSQDVESYDRATKLEEIGYSVMTMSPLLFQKINQAQVTKLAA